MKTALLAAYTNYRRDPRVRREAEALVDAGYRVVFLARRQKGEPDRETLAGVDVRKLPGLDHGRTSAAAYLADYAVFFLLLMAHLTWRPRRYDIIHVNNMPDFLVFAAWLPRLLGRPVIHDVHDLMPELYEEKFGVPPDHWIVRLTSVQERWAVRFATAVVTVEERLRQRLAAHVPIGKIEVLLNLPDDRIFALRSDPPAKPAGAPFVLVYHGTLARRLGLDLAVEAVACLRDRIPGLQLRIIGAGEERDSLIAQRDRAGLADRITFSDGFVAVERIPAMIADADVGVIPLRVSAGTDVMLPTKLLEYVGMGIPCVVPRTGTICRYFDETMVQFFEAESVESLAEAIEALYRDPARRTKLAATATERFGRRYAWREHRKVYVSLVDRLTGRTADPVVVGGQRT
jgi:glycosyltransferase involved in cell wall biosynthesis